MLCKTSIDIFSASWTTPYTSQTQYICSLPLSSSIKCHIRGTAKQVQGSQPCAWLVHGEVYIPPLANWHVVTNRPNNTIIYDNDFYPLSNVNVEFCVRPNGTNSVSVQYDITISANRLDNIHFTPSDVKEIWELTTWVIYWIDSDDIYKGGIIIGESTTATTGSITLGNAVGYLEVYYNGEVVKVPYYS